MHGIQHSAQFKKIIMILTGNHSGGQNQTAFQLDPAGLTAEFASENTAAVIALLTPGGTLTAERKIIRQFDPVIHADPAGILTDEGSPAGVEDISNGLRKCSEKGQIQFGKTAC